MAKPTKPKGVRAMDRKSMKSTKGGIIAVLKSEAAAPTDPLDMRKSGGDPTT